ncbi:MAG: phosphatase PAP2 family protein [Clostridia bacterium]|nr:phosphatase PAP2 family protein [Clostridia bacterium]
MSQIELILLVQKLQNTVIDYFFMAVTMLGTESAYLLLVPLIYWCFNREIGFRVGILFISSMFLNDWLKDWIQAPRPDPQVVRVLFAESGGGYSFPSGHAQGVATFWGYLAARVANSRFTYWAAALVLLVSLSRIYLGLHYPVDVLAGIALGLVIVYGFRQLEKGVIPKLKDISISWQLLLAIILSLALLILYHDGLAFKIVGAMIGLVSGYILSYRWVEFQVESPITRQLAKVGIGVATLVLLRVGAKALLPVSNLADLSSYFLITFGALFLVPIIFKRLELIKPQ